MRHRPQPRHRQTLREVRGDELSWKTAESPFTARRKPETSEARIGGPIARRHRHYGPTSTPTSALAAARLQPSYQAQLAQLYGPT